MFRVSVVSMLMLFTIGCSNSNDDLGDEVFVGTPIDEVIEKPVVETPVVETPVVETPVVETPVVETPVVDTPVVETPVVDTPVVETPVVETPVVETPVVETPVVETPVVETPVVDTPVVDTPVVDTPVVETPVVETPVVETPVVETPVIEDVLDVTNGVFPPTPTDITDNTSLYLEDGYSTLNVIRVDIRTATEAGICVDGDESGCTLADVIADVDKRDDLTVDIPVHFSSDDFANDGTVANAELRLRGGGSRFADQKSFRIKLDSKDVLWRNERFLQLNKHPFESSRIRNKFAFDIMSQIPNLPSARTQFVNLWIDDGEGPVDYGLFTHVERLNDDYLERHGLDKDGNLYQAEDFRFDISDLRDIRIEEDGSPLDKDIFETVLDIKEGKDHTALFKMMTDLNNPDVSFDYVLNKYFNENNVRTFVATNLLLRQWDVRQHNYYLYNPEDTELFYFLPWDYDAAMSAWREPDNTFDRESLFNRSIFGYASMSRNFFFESYLKQDGVHRDITNAAAFIRENYMVDSFLSERTAAYTEEVTPFQNRAPDSEFNPNHNEFSSRLLAENPAINHESLQNSFLYPTQPRMEDPVLVDGGSILRIEWSEAISVHNHSITYDLEFSYDSRFSSDSIILSRTRITDTNIELDRNMFLGSTYVYVRLIARPDIDPSRYWQIGSNTDRSDGFDNFGVVKFKIN